MKALIDVFRMVEISPEKRAKVIIKLGRVINNEHGANITEPLVFELVLLLDPNNEILKDKHFIEMAN